MPEIRDHSARLIRLAREMRKTPSDAERRLWSLVRKNRLGGFYFRRQVPIEGFIADFFCVAAKLVVEVDGAYHFTDEQQREYVEVRTGVFNRRGIRVVRFDARTVLKESVAVGRTILRELNSSVGPLPGPPPEYRGRGQEMPSAANPNSQSELRNRQSPPAVRPT
jgi:very-short-patch-repair endonuclease